MPRIELASPYFEDSAAPAVFNINFNGSIDGAEVVRIIRFISDDFQDLKDILNQNREAHLSLDNLQKLISQYNTWIELRRPELLKQYAETDTRASEKLIKYLMVLVYNRSILEPDKLNQYEPFSPEVYGETSFDLIDTLLKRVPVKENEIFVDLGSGVGNVVLQVAASTKCKCAYGFEKAEWPALYAVKMEREFRFWMRFFGKHFSKFKLYKADFFADDEHVQRYNPLDDTEGATITMNDYVKEIINEANLIFVNNYAFGAEVDHQLKLRFCNMLEGSLIVSSKPFCSLNFRINSRNLNDIGTILDISEEPLTGKVSWTDRPISYYFHRIDRTLLEKYFERLKNPAEYDAAHPIDGKAPRKSNSSLVISTSSGSTQSSAASSPTSSNSSFTSSRSHPQKAKSLSTPTRRKSSDKTKRNKKRKNEDSMSPGSAKSPKLHKKELSSKQKKPKSATASRSKSLDKDVLNTLAKMHRHVVKPGKDDLAKEFGLVASSLDASKQFNVNALTTLKVENQDNKKLSDCKISPKFLKSFKKERSSDNASRESRMEHKTAKKAKKIALDKKSISDKTASEDVLSKQKLGVGIMNAVDGYLKKMQRQYVKYLMHLKSNEYEESVKQELKDETHRKRELTARKEKVERLTKELLKNNVGLLKKRVEELGIRHFESPYQLIEYARKILTDNRQLTQKIDSVQKKVNNLSFNKNMLANIASASDSGNAKQSFMEDTNSRLKSLDSLLRKIDLKYARLGGVEVKKITNGKTRSISDDRVNSIESARSADETLSATDRMDNDDDRDTADDLDEELKTLDSSISAKGSKNKHQSGQKSTMSPAKAIAEQILNGGNSNSLNGWRSFKIPKQNSQASGNTKAQTPIASPALSTSSSSSSQTNKDTPQSNIQTSSQPDLQPPIMNSGQQHSNEKAYTSTNNNTISSSSSSSYYHPKKKQFRQYMMESQESSNPAQSSFHNTNSNSPYNSPYHPAAVPPAYNAFDVRSASNSPHFHGNNNMNSFRRA